MNDESDETLELSSLVIVKEIKKEIAEDLKPIFLATLIVAQFIWFGYVAYNWNSIVG